MKLTKNFYLSEFNCKDGTVVPAHLIDNVIELAENLQVLRDYIGKPIVINSAYRHEAYNSLIGGVKRSRHVLALASDIRIEGLTPIDIYNAIDTLILRGEMMEGGIGLYRTFVHYDIRGVRARWNKSK